jgi:hypothetical protein
MFACQTLCAIQVERGSFHRNFSQDVGHAEEDSFISDDAARDDGFEITKR